MVYVSGELGWTCVDLCEWNQIAGKEIDKFRHCLSTASLANEWVNTQDAGTHPQLTNTHILCGLTSKNNGY